MYLIMCDARDLGIEHPYTVRTVKHGKQRESEEYYTETAQPLYLRAPEQYTVGTGIHIAYDSGASGRKPRHCFKKSVSNTQLSGRRQNKRKHAECGKQHPAQASEQI
jgi:hypothetical protein